MNIEIIGSESLGVRGLCCFVKTKGRKILIDPGIALGYMRHKLLPHPVQVAMGETIQKKIISAWKESTDIVISHFHGDHVPLANPNPYQLNIDKLTGLKQDIRIWTKGSHHFSSIEKKRAAAFSSILNLPLTAAEGKKDETITFSYALPHGGSGNNSETVIMTRIEEDIVFVHTSDIQLLDDQAVDKILDWEPDVALADGPPIYLSRLSKAQMDKSWHNAVRLSQKIDKLILDHHLMRSREGLEWLKQLSHKTGNTVICAADFMQKPRLLLEADRINLYNKISVPVNWHEDYEKGKADTSGYWDSAKKLYTFRS